MSTARSDDSEVFQDTPNFPHYPPATSRGIPLLPHPKQGAPLIKLSMKMLNQPKVQKVNKPFRTNANKAFPKARKKVKYY